MSDSKEPANNAEDQDCDLEIAELLKFEPAPRKLKRANGWTPALQRRFIAKLAELGSPAKAAEALGRCRFGAEKLYKAEGAEGFREAWDRAIAIAEERAAARQEAERAQWAGVRPPGGVDRRMGAAGKAPPLHPSPEGEGGLDMTEEQKWEFMLSIGTRFMRKVAAEREARLGGEIVAADFYLRQITFLEVMFDLTSESMGWDVHEALRELRRGDTKLLQIVSTPFADWMDRSRRLWWIREGEPDRPPHPDVRFLERHATSGGEVSTYVDQHCYGAMTTPARGYTAEQWAEMDYEEQRRARQRQFDEDAAEQVEWERRAAADFEARQSSLSPHEGEGRGEGA